MQYGTTIVLVLLLAGTFADAADLFYGKDIPPKEATLFLANPAGDANSHVVAKAIVVATHGWLERSAWPRELATVINEKTDPNEWLCGWFDWRNQARLANPTDAARYARDIGGPLLAEQILRLSGNWKHIHLIGHSAGCWLISEAARTLAARTHASIHLTFLDAYVPLGWDEKLLGDFAAEPNTVCWLDHYFTRDITLKMTERWLTNAHNVDISDITPGIKDHEFPRYWYPATVMGKYLPSSRHKGKPLFHRIGNLDYGFARSLEAGRTNWQASLALPRGTTAVKMTKPE